MLKLFEIIVPEEKLHPNFKALLVEHHAPVRDVIEKWTEGFEDRDNKIVKEFQTSFNSSFWEFYIYAVLKELGFDIDFSHSSPDFCITKGNDNLILEATIASHADGANPEWIKGKMERLTPEEIHTIENIAMLRLSNAISAKHKSYIEKYSKLKHVENKPFIICIAPFEQPSFYVQADSAIRKLLYKFNAPIYNKTERGDVHILGNEYVDSVVKINESTVELGIFTDDRMKEVSAIIFSSTATATKAKALISDEYPETIFWAVRYQKDSWDVPYFISAMGGDYHESMCDGLHVFINPFAQNKFDPNAFFHEDIALHIYDTEEEITETYLNDGHLISHLSMNMLYGEDIIKNNATTQGVTEWKKVVAEQKDGILYPLNARVGIALNNHIARHKGWTIIVFMDDVDKDWGAIAKKIIVYRIQDFINSKNTESIISDVNFSDKDAAFSEIIRLIDNEQ
ncbi:hypothetical protein DA2_1475 [Desulfovibrio sp. A2]|nr:hypothetical protein DA2_1475 [Desulfovibrio sp. A2]